MAGMIAGPSGFAFSSSAPTVAAVSSTSSVLGVTAGTSTITASLSRDGVTRTATAAVTRVLPDRGAVSGTADDAFVPDSIVISKGGQVTFTFQAMHNVNFLGAGAPPNIPTTSGASIDRIFASTGDFPFTCSLHGGLTGIVKVR